MTAVITLTTDFGLQDAFAGIMKGVILGINPEANIVDVTHQVTAFDVLEGALVLAASYAWFPTGSIHVAVVDPGVGSERRPILVATPTAYFVGPDNGLFTVVYQNEPAFEVRELTAERYFRTPVSCTFHGRDIFAPAAAWLSRGESMGKFGPLITDYVRLDIPKPNATEDGTLHGTVLRIDRFGNLITNLRAADLPSEGGFRMLCSGQEVSRLVESYAEGNPQEAFAIVGSTGFVEIAAREASAAKMLRARRGAEVRVIAGSKTPKRQRHE